ncbi:MAG TPA: hypothetical protein VJW76_17175 [Verrucomicrobiae bacterium]|nr:hypothetical protein [Verrucomicrobiae bacterium]
MDNDKEKQLEELIHRELRNLPEVAAPPTLLHRVMLAVHENARRPWWVRSWVNWPLGMQMISLAVLLASAGLVSYFLGAAWDGFNVTSMSSRVVESFAWLKPIWEIVSALVGAAAVMLRVTGQQFLLIGAAIVVLAYVTCVALGTVCVRMAFYRPERFK